MTMLGFFRLFFWLVLMLFFSTTVFSNVEVFSNYDTILQINTNNTIEVNKSLSLKNVYDVGIVPGQIEFKIGKGVDGSISQLLVDKAYAYDKFGNEIKTTLRNTEDFSVIILDVYYPLLPGFEYDFNLYYSLSYDPSGIFFKSLQIPLRESTIPIEKGDFQVRLPDNYYFTYLSSEGKNASIAGNVANWGIENDLPKSVTFEYSYLPVKFGEMKGSYIFWISINVLLFLFLIYEIRKEYLRIKVQQQNVEE